MSCFFLVFFYKNKVHLHYNRLGICEAQNYGPSNYPKTAKGFTVSSI